MEMKSAVDVDDTDVQKMVEESVEHAFDDMKARQWIEAKMQAEATLKATRKGLHDYASELEADYRQQVGEAIHAVEAIILLELRCEFPV